MTERDYKIFICYLAGKTKNMNIIDWQQKISKLQIQIEKWLEHRKFVRTVTSSL